MNDYGWPELHLFHGASCMLTRLDAEFSCTDWYQLDEAAEPLRTFAESRTKRDKTTRAWID